MPEQLTSSDLARIAKAAELARDRELFVLLEPNEALALVEAAKHHIFSALNQTASASVATVHDRSAPKRAY